MARIRTKPINPFIQALIDEYKAKDLKDLSAKTGIPYETLRGYADIQGRHQVFEAILRDSARLGISPEQFMLRMLGQAS